MGAGLHPPLLLLRTCVDYVFMERIERVVSTVVMAPVWIPVYVGLAVFRWFMGRDLLDDH